MFDGVIWVRRKDREVTNEKDIDAVLSRCEVCRLAFNDGDSPYIVPLNFGFEHTEKGRVLYFHCAKDGKKTELAKKTLAVSFEADRFELVSGNTACDYTARFESVVGSGKISVVSDECTAEKRKALNLIMEHYTDVAEWEYGENMLKRVCILKLEIKKITCKANV